MNMFEGLLLNIILISFPILVYTLHIVANKNISKKDKEFLFDLVLLSSTFLEFHYGSYLEGKMVSFFLGSIVFLSLVKERYMLTVLLEIVVLETYYPNTNAIISIFFLYLVIDFLFFCYCKYRIKKIPFFQVYFLTYNSFYLIFFFLIDKKHFLFSLFALFFYMVLVRILILLVTQGEEIMKNHVEFKELQKEKQIRLSLFKITHEIKNPVAVCKAYLDMFDTSNLEHAKKYVPILREEIERLLLLLQDFLLVNKANMKYEVMDLNMLLEEVAKNMQPLMEENHILFKTNMIDDELFIHGDYHRLSQVMMNLLKNSVEANAKKIILHTNLSSKYLEVYVDDNGQGIEDDIRSKIYEPFYTTKPRGSGLGVSLSNEIIHAHNGTLEYFSKSGYGTRVKITLPLYPM